MKPNKSPGIDGITAEFLSLLGKIKIFHCKLYKHLFRKGHFLNNRSEMFNYMPAKREQR